MTKPTSKLSRFRAIPPLLRIIIFLLAAIAIVLAGVGLPIAETPDFYADGLRPVIIIMVTPIAAYSILWSIVAMIVLFFNGPYHPAIDIGFDVFGWMGCWACGIVTIVYTEYLSDVGFYCDPYYEGDYDHECGLARQFDGLYYSAAVLLAIVGSIFLALWIMECKATHKRRMTKKRESFHELDDVDELNKATTPGNA